MMVMTAKVDFKKIIMIMTAAAALILAAILLLGGGEAESTPTTVSAKADSNDGRVQFLKNYGWDVTTAPTESGQVKIPADTSEVFDRYNTLQKGQGYDLSVHAGKNVMRYVYKINNYPGATAPVYATLLVHNNQVIGGDVTDTSPGGKIHSFKMPQTAATPNRMLPTETPQTESSLTEP